jgi:metal-responsive CopG/Arc/MetJ family transcriptional regulator
MGRPKLKEENKKGKLGISISKELINKIDNITDNKSVFIENLIIKYFTKDGK